MGPQFCFSVKLDNKVLAIRMPAVCSLDLPPGKSQKLEIHTKTYDWKVNSKFHFKSRSYLQLIPANKKKIRFFQWGDTVYIKNIPRLQLIVQH